MKYIQQMMGASMMLLVGTLHASEMSLYDEFMSNQSAGIIYPLSSYLKQIEPLCGNSAKGLYMTWFDRNKTLVDRVNVSQIRYYKKVAKESGNTAAVQVKAEQDNASSDLATKLTRMFAIQSTDNQEKYCKSLNTAVNSGKWDIKEKYPDIYNYLTSLQLIR